MRAVVCRSFDDPSRTRVEDVASPALAAGCVRILVHVAGVSFANLLVLRGRHQNRSEPPFTPGTEISGVVTECAPGVTRVRVGQRVAAGVRQGGFADEAIVPERTVYPLPDAVDFIDAVHFPTIYATAWAAFVWRAHLQAGETVLVHGAGGGSGLAAVDVARCLGARVIAVAGSEARCDAARRHGADFVLDHRRDALVPAVLQATDGRGADVVFDPVGGDVFRESLRCIAPEGRIIPMGFASGEIPAVAANLALVKNISVLGVYWGYYAGWGRQPPAEGIDRKVLAAFAEMLQWCAQGRVRPETWKVFALEDFRAALSAIEGREVVGRVALRLR